MTGRVRRFLKQYFVALLWIIPLAFLIRSFGYGLYRTESGSMEPTLLVGDRVFSDKFSIHFWSPSRGDIVTFNDPQYAYSHSPILAKIQALLWGPRNVTKRIIAVPGDHLKGVIEAGKPVIYLNGKKLDEPYVNPYPLVPVDAWRGVWKTYVPDKPHDQQPYYHLDESRIKAAQKWLERRGRPSIRPPFVPLELSTPTDPNLSESPLRQIPADKSQSNQTQPDRFDVVLAENQFWVMGDNRQASIDSRHWGPLNGNLIHGRICCRLWSIDSDNHWFVIDLVLHPIDFWKKLRWPRSFQSVR